MQKIIVCILLSLLTGTINAQLKHLKDIGEMPAHPRILLFDEDIQKIKENISNNKIWADLNTAIITESDRIIGLPVLERKQTGRRILDVSREGLRRIFHLSYSYRITDKQQYMQRAEKEMLAISEFKDWNPSHFLDVAEMTLAMSIGYDWLYNGLPEQSRNIIKNAIITKGLDPSFSDKYNDWLKSNHNWNQVCNAGITYGAIAIFEDIPELSKLIIDRSIESIKLPMSKYGPDGAYPEGVVYWSYGTSFNVMFLSAIEKLFNTDFGLSSIKGFLPSAQYVSNMITPSQKYFNYGDAGDPAGLSPTMFWFADKTGDNSILWNQLYYINNRELSTLTRGRLFPVVMAWGKDVDINKITPPTGRLWFGQGVTPVAAMRTSWIDSGAIYVGLKAGRAGSNHSHMDIGSFIMEADGVRWAIDLGPQDYNSLESIGIDLWNRKQNSQRWDVYRYNNFAHSTLTFDGQKQNVNGHTSINNTSENPKFTFAISDISNAYKEQIKSAIRGTAIVDNSFVVVQDEIETLDKATSLKWSMVTKAKVRIKNSNTIEFTQEGKKMTLKVESSDKIKVKSWPAKSQNAYDASNDGVTIVGFETMIPANSKKSYCIKLIPANAKQTGQKIPALSQWK